MQYQEAKQSKEFELENEKAKMKHIEDVRQLYGQQFSISFFDVMFSCNQSNRLCLQLEAAQLAETYRLSELSLQMDLKQKEEDNQARAQQLQHELSIKQEETRKETDSKYMEKSHELMMKLIEKGCNMQEISLGILCVGNALKPEASRDAFRQQGMLAQQIFRQSSLNEGRDGSRRQQRRLQQRQYDECSSEAEEGRIIAIQGIS